MYRFFFLLGPLLIILSKTPVPCTVAVYRWSLTVYRSFLLLGPLLINLSKTLVPCTVAVYRWWPAVYRGIPPRAQADGSDDEEIRAKIDSDLDSEPEQTSVYGAVAYEGVRA